MKNTFKIELIKNYIKENNLTVNKFCKICNVKKHVYYKILHNKLNFDANNIFRIARILEIQVHEIFNS